MSTGTAKKTAEPTMENVVKFMDKAIAYVKGTTYTDREGNEKQTVGMHVKLTGFNGAFKQHFGVDTAENMRLVDGAVENAMSDDGKTKRYFKRGAPQGPIICRWEDRPKSGSRSGELDAKAKGLLAAAGKK